MAGNFIFREQISQTVSGRGCFAMGEGNEQQPLAIIKNAPIEFCEKVSRKELYIDPKEDMYRPLLSRLPQK